MGRERRMNPVGLGMCEYDENMLYKILKEIFLNKLT